MDGGGGGEEISEDLVCFFSGPSPTVNLTYLVSGCDETYVSSLVRNYCTPV